jgi:hypothetical protein
VCIACGSPAFLKSEWNLLVLACPDCFLFERVLLVEPAAHHEPGGLHIESPNIRILAG